MPPLILLACYVRNAGRLLPGAGSRAAVVGQGGAVLETDRPCRKNGLSHLISRGRLLASQDHVPRLYRCARSIIIVVDTVRA
eukprot:808729-Rhodomonas_salina.1